MYFVDQLNESYFSFQVIERVKYEINQNKSSQDIKLNLLGEEY